MDLTAGYREWAPPNGLGDAVACVWARVVPVDDPHPVPTLVLPDACSDLIWYQGRGVTVAGPDTAPWETHLGAGSVLIGARFTPGASGPALRLPLDALQDQRVRVGLSERQLRRRCRQSVGYGPKMLQRILRFRRFVGWTAQRPSPGRDLSGPASNLAGLAAAAGYADQAHLTRECRDLAGMTPTALQRRSRR